MATCRCPMCGVKNAGKGGGMNRAHRRVGRGRDEHGRSFDWGRDRDRERRTLRRAERAVWKAEAADMMQLDQ